MANKKGAKKETPDGAAAVSKTAPVVGATSDRVSAPKKVRIPKLIKKDKSRTPRKQKKAQQKAAAAKS
jgi:hypothetical protein